jgi:hypothetical protein
MALTVCQALTRNVNGTWTTFRAVAIINPGRMTGLLIGQMVHPGLALADLDVVLW